MLPVRPLGTTLLEMLLVLVLIAAAGALAAGLALRGSEGGQLRHCAREIAAQLRYLRTQAIVTGQPQRFAIDPQGRRWQGRGDRPGRIPPGLAVRFTGAREAQTGDGQGAILFFADGASTGGRVELQAGTAVWRVDVSWLTGEVEVERAAPERGR